ncbi:O-methyltransferase family protein [C1] [hydrothermal vent metagenome]|uniref:O-methyltransferase family protein [C1] n=1 Tax=hydrothermal vent metagenome TaxID=652676 RepID=A0A3B0WF54_9ZZZZ
MSNRTLSIDDRLYDYICDVSINESELLRQLREETALIEYSVMQISPEQGQFMSLLIKLMSVKRAIEIGTFTGYSSICIANAMSDDGRLICCDISPQWTNIAEKYWARAELENKINLFTQPADITLQMLIDKGDEGSFDFIFIDADKQNYIQYYEMALQLLRKGGMMAVDNTLWSGAVADPENSEPGTRAIRRFNEMVKQDNRVTSSLVTIGDGLTLILKEFD